MSAAQRAIDSPDPGNRPPYPLELLADSGSEKNPAAVQRVIFPDLTHDRAYCRYRSRLMRKGRNYFLLAIICYWSQLDGSLVYSLTFPPTLLLVPFLSGSPAWALPLSRLTGVSGISGPWRPDLLGTDSANRLYGCQA